MNKKDLITVVAEKTGLTKKDGEKAVTALFDAITEALAGGEKVQISGFGIFDVKERPERQAINPRTKEPITVPAAKVPQFRAAKTMKEAVDA